MGRTPGEHGMGSEWLRVAAACLPGLVVGLSISYFDGRSVNDQRTAQKLSELVVQIERLAMTCDNLIKKTNKMDNMEEEHQEVVDRVTRLEMQLKMLQ